MKDRLEILQEDEIITQIFFIRQRRVMIDKDLAQLYEVETRTLNQAVRRNLDLFPPDFMLILTREEINNLSHFVTSSKIKHAPNVFAFSEQGVAMLSCVAGIYPNTKILRHSVIRADAGILKTLDIAKNTRYRIKSGMTGWIASVLVSGLIRQL